MTATHYSALRGLLANKRLKQKQTGISTSRLLLCYGAIAFGLPLIAVPLHMNLSKSLRWGALLTLASLLIGSGYVRRNLQQLNRVAVVLIGFIVGMAVVSTLLSNLPAPVRLIGWDTEYLGLLSWLAFFAVAIGLRTSLVQFLQSRWALLICAAVLAVSLLMDYAVLFYGYRLGGLLQQATGMGMFAAAALLLAQWHIVYHKHKPRQHVWLLALVALASCSILLTQSRIAQAGGLLTCFVLLVAYGYERRKLALVPLLTALVLLIAPAVFHNYFHRLQAEQVREGFSYRADLYRSSYDDVLSKHTVVGLGASGIPETINSRQDAPPGIVESLDTGFVFLSAHDIFLDVALGFGMLAGLAFIGLIGQALGSLLVGALQPDTVLIGTLFLLTLLNGIFNVPSIELTLLLVVSMVALLPGRRLKKPK